jgi:hypothetical protein
LESLSPLQKSKLSLVLNIDRGTEVDSAFTSIATVACSILQSNAKDRGGLFFSGDVYKNPPEVFPSHEEKENKRSDKKKSVTTNSASSSDRASYLKTDCYFGLHALFYPRTKPTEDLSERFDFSRTNNCITTKKLVIL